MASDNGHRTLLDRTRYAGRVRKVLDALTTLQHGNRIAFSPPKLVLLGGHGSGKSSLIEAITQIPVPCSIEGERCTKCPMEIRLRRGNEGSQWSCSVSVLRKTSSLRGPNELVPFDSTTNKADLQLLLQRARLATFNPSNFVSYRLNVEDPPQPDREDQISEDVIIVNITGAAIELTLIDLPGFLDEEPFLTTVVENMAERYVSQDDMLNLVVIPAEHLYYVDRQMAAEIARKNDHQSNRTIGVFTKADDLEPGAETDWINEFLIQRPSLIHGSFVTRSLVPIQNGTWDERRQLERLSLESPQWSQSEVNAYCGTERFAAGLGEALDGLLRRRIKYIVTNLQGSIKGVDVQLETLPRYFGNAPEFELRAYCEKFVSDMTEFLSASRGEVQRETMSGLEELKTRLIATRLLFDPQSETGNVAVSHDGIECISFAEIRRIVTAHTGDGLFRGQTDKAIKELINRSVSKWPEICLSSFDHIKFQIRQYMESYGLELLKTVNTKLGREVSEKMAEILEDAATKSRELLVEICKQETTQTAFTMHDKKFQKMQISYANEVREWRQHEHLSFDSRPSDPPRRISSGLEAAIMPRPQQLRILPPQSDVQVISRPLPPVLSQPNRYQQIVAPQASIQPYVQTVSDQQSPLSGHEQNPRFTLSTDPFEQEIQIMSSVVAYLELAVDRFTDSIAMTIITFWKGLGDELKGNLEKKLNLTAERVAWLALDYSDIRQKRRELMRMKSVLVEVLGKLRGLEKRDDVAET